MTKLGARLAPPDSISRNWHHMLGTSQLAPDVLMDTAAVQDRDGGLIAWPGLG
jgi:ABC-type dipeptide/oligopeptide/nickel transport system permease subunit